MSTLRIEAFKDTLINGNKFIKSSVGTGFYFEFNINESKVEVLVTNAHVIRGFNNCKLRFTEYDGKGPMYGSTFSIIINDFKNNWLFHPTEDLAIFPLNVIRDSIAKTKKRPFIVPIPESYILKSESLKDINEIEDVLMIGYPRGLFDTFNNLPVVRKGITATPLKVNYENKPLFLLDIPIYPGSSGSPVFLHNVKTIFEDNGPSIQSLDYLVGINSQSVNFDFTGDIVNTNPIINTKTNLPIDIAVIIKATELLAFKPLIIKVLK